MKIYTLYLYIHIFLIAVPSFASFDRQYEYRSFSEKEMEVPDYFDKIDSEYTSDILTYSITPTEEVLFQETDKQFLISLGSLSRREFMKDARLKIKQKLNDKIDFKYNYLEQKDFENSQTHSVAEFVIKPLQKVHFSAFAELDFSKVNDNVGFSFSYLPQMNHEVKFFYNMVQFDRNKRNSLDDRFNKKPYTFGFVGRHTKEKFGKIKYFEYGFLNETSVEWIFPTQDINYEYQRWMGTLRYLNPINEFETFAIFYQLDHRNDLKEALSTEVPISSLDLQRNQLQLNYNNINFEKFELDSGSYIVYRDANLLTGIARYLDVVPYATFHFNKDKDSAEFWSLGYDVDIHRTDKKDSISKQDTKINHRGNVFWTARFNPQAYLKLAGTLDIDDLSWEGGNGKFVMEF